MEYRRQLEVINDLIESTDDGIYLCGKEVSLADATLFPSIVFARYMLPKFDVPVDEALPPKINSWFEDLCKHDADFKKVHDEVSVIVCAATQGLLFLITYWKLLLTSSDSLPHCCKVMSGLEKWESNGRWDTIWLAGCRDIDPPTIFDKIIAGEIPASIVKEDSKILAFKDINPAAPSHVLIIPKDRSGLLNLRKASPEHIEILGRLMVAAGEISKDASLGFGDGARIVINDGPDGGQEIPHLHVHVLGGRQMSWPPG